MMKKVFQKIKHNKLLTLLILLAIIFLLLGFFYITILNNENKAIIKENTNNYLMAIKNNTLKYQTTFFKTTISNTLTNSLIWLLGISLIGIIFIFLIFIFKCFLFSFTFTSIIYNKGLKGLLFATFYSFPLFLNLIVCFFLTYYALSFSIMLFNYFFRKKDYNRKVIVKRYLKIFLFTFFISLVSSICESFLIPKIIKLIYF